MRHVRASFALSLAALVTVISPGQGLWEGIPTRTIVVPARTIPERRIPGRFIPGRTIPARMIPGRLIPGRTIPGRTIPAMSTVFGTIPEQYIAPVTIPDTMIPDTYIPETVIPDTWIPETVIPEMVIEEFRYEVPDLSRISRDELARRFGGGAWLGKGGVVTPMPAPREALPPPTEHLAVAERNRRFLAREGYGPESLLALFARADVDGSRTLAWKELEGFQRSLYRTYAYKSNATAIRPDEFIACGGGDCEDWALLTAACCAYWGWTAFLGSYSSPRDSEAHALCLVRAPTEIPSGYSYLELSGIIAFDGAGIPDGRYVPVDYDLVGGFSNAVKKGWTLQGLMTPQAWYGKTI